MGYNKDVDDLLNEYEVGFGWGSGLEFGYGDGSGYGEGWGAGEGDGSSTKDSINPIFTK